MRTIEVSKNDRILVIAPHPDDECIGPGGILLKYPKQSDIILLTDGRQGQGDISPVKGKGVREQEFISEMRKLGIASYKMLGIEDGTLLAHTDCLEDVNISAYTLIFVTGLQDDHPDHKAAFLCLEAALKNTRWGNHPRCFLYEIHTPLQNPTHFLDISDVIKKKVELVRIHTSQLKELPYDRLVEQGASYRATLFRMPRKKIEVYEEVDLSKERTNYVSETEVLLQKERLIGWTLKHWVHGLLGNKTLVPWFREQGIDEVYIYGFGELGKLLVNELLQEEVEVRAVIDRRAEQFNDDEISVIHIDEVMEPLPVIVTVIYEYKVIEKSLYEYGFERIFSLKDILEGM